MLKLQFIDDILSSRKRKTPEEEKRAIVEEARALEEKFIARAVSKEGYAEQRKRLELTVACLELECIFIQKVKEVGEFISKHEDMQLSEEKMDSLEALARKLSMAQKDAREARKLFEKQRLTGKEFFELLKDKISEAETIEVSVRAIFKERALATGKQLEVLNELQKRLEAETAGEIAEDLYIQVPEEQETKVREPRRITKTSHKV